MSNKVNLFFRRVTLVSWGNVLSHQIVSGLDTHGWNSIFILKKCWNLILRTGALLLWLVSWISRSHWEMKHFRVISLMFIWSCVYHSFLYFLLTICFLRYIDFSSKTYRNKWNKHNFLRQNFHGYCGCFVGNGKGKAYILSSYVPWPMCIIHVSDYVWALSRMMSIKAVLLAAHPLHITLIVVSIFINIWAYVLLLACGQCITHPAIYLFIWTLEM